MCELAGVPSYVLKGWEAEFPDLGVAKTAGGPRAYRRSDVERVLQLKQLIMVDGLTLAGARKRLTELGALTAPVDEVAELEDAAPVDTAARDGLKDVKEGLQWIMGLLEKKGADAEFALEAPVKSKKKSSKASK